MQNMADNFLTASRTEAEASESLRVRQLCIGAEFPYIKLSVIPRNPGRSGAAALLLFCLFAAPGLSAADSSLKTSAGSTQHLVGIHKRAVGLPNFGQVTPNLFRGAQPGSDGYRTLQSMGVNIVVDMRGNRSEQNAVEKLGMRYVSIPWKANSPSDEAIARFLKLVDENPDKKIFVHCRVGEDRTGIAIASYRMAKEGWSPDEAMKEMQLFGFNGFHHLIFPQLVRFERDFPQHLKTSSAFQQLQATTKSSPPQSDKQ